jgi:hypothetical protein
MSNLRSFISVVGYCFLFRKPLFTFLDYTDLIIDDKAVFLLTWKLVNGHKVKIKPLGRKYYSKEQSLIIRLDFKPIYIDIIACNYWRITRKRVKLNFIRLDDQTASLLIRGFMPLSTTVVNDFPVTVTHKKIGTRIFDLRLKISDIRFSKGITVKSSKFKYPSNTFYERSNDQQIL